MGNLRASFARAFPALILAATFLSVAATILGARLWVINNFGSSLAIHDQWGAEGFYLLKPWLEGRLDFTSLFAPHNEHRIFFSRILALGLTQMNGQWDSLPEMVFNAALAALLGVALLYILVRQLGGQYLGLGAIVVTVWLALPYAQENTLWGFQSAFYFLLLFSVFAIWGLTDDRAWTFRWWLGAFGAVCACLSVASGFLASVVVVALLGARIIQNPKSISTHAATLALASLLVLAGFYFRVSPPGHQILKAYSLKAGLLFLARSSAFPFSGQPLMALVIYLPLAALAFVWITRGRSPDRKLPAGTELVLALGLWVVLQNVALAYSRGGNGHGPIASRYMDILALGAGINALALFILLKATVVKPGTRKTLWTSAFVWSAVVVAGTASLSYSELVNQKGRQSYLRAGERAIRSYLITGEHAFLEGEPHPVPYIDMRQFQTFIDDPSIRRLLPAPARLPIHLEKAEAADRTFVQPGCPPEAAYLSRQRSWGSFTSDGPAARARMQSHPIRPHLPYLEFEIAGGLGDDMSLSVESRGGADTIHWLPLSFQEPGSGWRRAYSAADPRAEVRVSAKDNSVAKWFAFREPAELGRLSLYSEKAVARGKPIFILGLMLGLAVLACSGVQQFRVRRGRGISAANGTFV